jgi:hypothetical protein
MISRISN